MASNEVKILFFLPTKEPNFVYMDVVPEGEDSPEGDDDKVYMFFSENAVEYDFYNKLVVSRVARVCKVILHQSLYVGIFSSDLIKTFLSLFCRVTWVVKGPSRRNGLLSWRLVWTALFLNPACPTSYRTSFMSATRNGGKVSFMQFSPLSRKFLSFFCIFCIWICSIVQLFTIYDKVIAT